MRNYMIEDPLMWEKINNDIGRAAGIYKLRCLSPSPENNYFLPIHRIAGIDDGGILYIGTAIDLAYRLATVRKSICAAFGVKYKDAGAHSTGKCFSKYEILRELFVLSRLCITIDTVVQTPEEPADHFALENAAIDSYAVQFGEAPPLNSMGRTGVS